MVPKIYMALGFALLLAALAYFYMLAASRGETISDLKSYSEAMSDTATHYKNQNGDLVTQVRVAVMSKEAMEVTHKRDLEEITSKFNVKFNRVEQLVKQTLEATARFDTGLTDTVIVVDSVARPAFAFDNKDQWFHIKGIVDGRTITLEPKLIAPIYGVVYRGRRSKKFLFFRYGPRELRYEVTSTNPYVEITVDKFVEKRP